MQYGDTLYSIAWRHQLEVRHLARLNTITPPYLIRPGQTLHLRGTPPTTTRPAHSAPRARATKPRPSTRPGRSTIQWNWPAQGRLVSTFKSGDSLRNGIRLAVAPGTPVRASAAGRVVYSGGGLIGYGQLVIIKHDADYLSAYGHNRSLRVRTGQQVAKGTLIAESGRTQTGQPRLHIEIRYRGKPVNPLRLLPPR